MRKLLVNHTRQAHEDLHSHPRITPLMRDDVSKAYYADLLADYHDFYSAVEAVRSDQGWKPDLSLARQVAALDADLISLDQPAHSAMRYTPGLQSEAECLGALYVLIGAQFGGQIIGGHIATALPNVSCQYFSRHSSDIAQWRQLLAAVEALPERGPQRSATLAGATTTFEDFGRHLSRSQQDAG